LDAAASISQGINPEPSDRILGYILRVEFDTIAPEIEVWRVVMYLRFVIPEVDATSNVSLGLFHAAA
jgi:hypothetical protein